MALNAVGRLIRLYVFFFEVCFLTSWNHNIKSYWHLLLFSQILCSHIMVLGYIFSDIKWHLLKKTKQIPSGII